MAPIYHFNIHAVPLFVTSIFVMILATFVLSKNLRSPSHKYFFAICISVFIWLTATGMGYISTTATQATFWFKIDNFAVMFTSPCFFALTAYETGRRLKKSIIIGILIAAIFGILGIANSYFISESKLFYWGFFPQWKPLNSAPFFIFWFGYSIASFIILNKERRFNISPLKRNQVKFLMLGFAIIYTATVDFLATLGIIVYPFGFIPTFIFLSIIAYAILKHRLMDIHIIIRWSTVVSVLAVVLTSLYVTGVVFATKYFNMDMMGIRLLVTVFIVGTLLLFHRTIKRIIESMVLMREKDEKEELDELYQNLATTLDLKELKWIVISELEAIFRTRCVTLVLFDLKERRFKVHASVGYEEIEKVRITKENPLVTWLMNNNRPAVYEWLDAEREEDKKVQDVMDELNMTVAMVLAHNDTMVGMLGMSEKKRRRYTADEIVLFAEFCEKMAVPFTNAVKHRLGAGQDEEDEQGEAPEKELPSIPVPPSVNEPGKPKMFFRNWEVKDDPKDPYSVYVGPFHAVNTKWDWIKARDRYDPATKEIHLGGQDGGDDGGKDAS